MQETIEAIDERLRHLWAVAPESPPPAAEFEILADSLLGQEFATFSQLVDRADLLRAALHRVGWPRRSPPTRESPYLKAWGKLIKLYTKATQHPAAVPSSPYCALAHERQSWCLLRMMLIFWFELTRVPDTLWGGLHQALLRAERANVANRRVDDGLFGTPLRLSCREVHHAAALIHLANPNALPMSMLPRVVTFALELATYAQFVPPEWLDRIDDRYGIDLAGNSPPIPALALADAKMLRLYDAGALIPKVHMRLAQTGLSTDERLLLETLSQRWTGEPPKRQEPREPSNEGLQVVSDWPAIYFYFTGRAFEPPTAVSVRRTFEEAQRIQLFGGTVSDVDLTEREREKNELLYSPHLTQWDAMDRSPKGWRIRRSGARSELTRWPPGRLLLVRKHPKTYGGMLTRVRWRQATFDGEIHLGLEQIPGIPRPTAVQHFPVVGAPPTPWYPAFWFPDTSRGDEGTHRLLAPLEIGTEAKLLNLWVEHKTRGARVQEVLEKGEDYLILTFFWIDPVII